MALSLRLPSRTRFQRRDDPVVVRAQPNDATDGIVLRLAAVDSSRSAQVVRVRAPASERVELMADFTDWEPVSLVRTPAGVWEITLPIQPGSHRLNVRLDGGDWVVPTNLARVTDEFGSIVGLLLVR
jgi:1,4-alpha-glucan branching enzyme